MAEIEYNDHSFHQGGHDFTCVCLFIVVFLFFFPAKHKITEQVSTKLGWTIDLSPILILLAFGVDLDKKMNPGTIHPFLNVKIKCFF